MILVLTIFGWRHKKKFKIVFLKMIFCGNLTVLFLDIIQTPFLIAVYICFPIDFKIQIKRKYHVQTVERRKLGTLLIILMYTHKMIF